MKTNSKLSGGRKSKKAEQPAKLPEMVEEVDGNVRIAGVSVEEEPGVLSVAREDVVEGELVSETVGNQLVSESELAGALAIQDGPTEAGRKAMAEAAEARAEAEKAKPEAAQVAVTAAKSGSEEERELADNAANPAIGKKVRCCGLDCGKIFEIAARTVGITTPESFQPLCWEHGRLARDAGLLLDKFEDWSFRRERRAKRAEAMRGISFSEHGSSKEETHATLLDMDGDAIQMAMVARCEILRHKTEVKYLVLKNRGDLAAFRETHSMTPFEARPAMDALEVWEKADREAKRERDRQVEHFHNIDAQKKKEYEERGRRKLAQVAAQKQHLLNLAGKGGCKSEEAFGSDISPRNVLQGSAPLTHNPLADKLGAIVSNKDSAN